MLRGDTPQLGAFRIRIVEREGLRNDSRLELTRLTDSEATHLSPVIMPYEFAHLKGKTNFVGIELPTGQLWHIKGQSFIFVSPNCLTRVDAIQQFINKAAQGLMESGGYSLETNPPDPFALFRLPNQISPGVTNVFAFQKGFGKSIENESGNWGFDVYYESMDGADDFGGMTCS